MQSRAWHQAGLPLAAIAVNLSARQFRQDNLLDVVTRILLETGLDPELLEMELTESMVMHNADAAITVLRSLKALGVRLSVDDFGAGYSSLSYLRRLPIDTLKIDRSFVRDIADTRKGDGGILAQAIISLGHNLRLKVIAEGVETAAQLSFLRRHSCDEVQGYYFSKPLPAAEYARMVAGPHRWMDRWRHEHGRDLEIVE
jgi:EAL domain-containing protein (putative c-di-GMP-specific phosphodiesterase class I)